MALLGYVFQKRKRLKTGPLFKKWSYFGSTVEPSLQQKRLKMIPPYQKWGFFGCHPFQRGTILVPLRYKNDKNGASEEPKFMATGVKVVGQCQML